MLRNFALFFFLARAELIRSGCQIRGAGRQLSPAKQRPAGGDSRQQETTNESHISACWPAAHCSRSARPCPLHALDKVTFGTNWLAEAEHGGFYQAVADGTYSKYGLDVTIVQGGPQSPNEALLISGKVDFYMGSQPQLYDDVKKGVPVISVAAIFQKDPQILMAHPDARHQHLRRSRQGRHDLHGQ